MDIERKMRVLVAVREAVEQGRQMFHEAVNQGLPLYDAEVATDDELVTEEDLELFDRIFESLEYPLSDEVWEEWWQQEVE